MKEYFPWILTGCIFIGICLIVGYISYDREPSESRNNRWMIMACINKHGSPELENGIFKGCKFNYTFKKEH